MAGSRMELPQIFRNFAMFGEAFEDMWPAESRTHARPILPAGITMTGEAAMDETDARVPLAAGSKLYVDFARLRGVRLRYPSRPDMPAQHDSFRREPAHHARAVEPQTVRAAFPEHSAFAALKKKMFKRLAAPGQVAGPPVIDIVTKQREGAVARKRNHQIAVKRVGAFERRSRIPARQ